MAELAQYSRTKKGIKNGLVSLTFKILSLLLGFISRKIFLDTIGSDILGVDSVAKSILGILNFVELGIGSAVYVTLYKPLYAGDKNTVKEIVALQGWLYRWVGIIILAGSIIISLFFPSIFSNTDLPLYYAYICFGSYLIRTLTSYFISYRYLVLSADQKEYKVKTSFESIILIKTILQIVCVLYIPGNPFFLWIGIETVGYVIANLSMSSVTTKNYPFLKEKVPNPSRLVKKYPDVIKKIKQLFFQKVGNMIIAQTGPIIIYALISVSTVTLYNNYLVITNSLYSLTLALFTGLTPAMGNMIAENNECACKRIFREEFAMFFYIATTFAICLWFLTQDFIGIWIGNEYILDNKTLALIIVIFYLSLTRYLFESNLIAYGLFSDIWCPAVEVLLNVSLSIILERFYGLNGIIAGVVISHLFIHIWKPIFLLRKGLKFEYRKYIVIYIKYFLAGLATFFISSFMTKMLNYHPDTILSFLVYGAVVFLLISIPLFGILYLTDSGMKDLSRRMWNIIINRK